MILGPNGTGKTTLLEHLAAPADLIEGHLEVHGQEVGSDITVQDYFSGLGFLPQKWVTYRGFTVRDTIQYSAWLKGLGSKAAREAADRVMTEFDLTDHAARKVHKLSGGLQQRVGIAEAFVNKPHVVLLDEPTVGLDPQQRSSIRKFLKSHASDTAIVVSTHLTDDVEAVADRVIVVNDGACLFDGTPGELAAYGSRDSGAATGVEAGYLAVIEAKR